MKPLRCAVYTRKSTEDGLGQEFNSLDAQREACEAYILSIGVQSGPPIGAQKGPLCGYEDPLMLSACFALLAA